MEEKNILTRTTDKVKMYESDTTEYTFNNDYSRLEAHCTIWRWNVLWTYARSDSVSNKKKLHSIKSGGSENNWKTQKSTIL